MPHIDALRSELATTLRDMHAAGWCTATAGNVSAVIDREPLRLVMSPSGADKGRVHPDDLIEVDGEAHTVSGHGTPSAETRLHLTVIAAREARAVLHSHSLWNTILSAEYCATGVVEIAGYELLKGLSGVTTHEHRERIPVLRNSQDMRRLSDELADVLDREPAAHGFLLAGHGLYTWGASLSEARRHLEALEFLLQVVGTRLLLPRGRCSQAEN